MTHEFADIAVFKLLQMCCMFGLILFASNAASTKQAEAIKAKKKTTARVPGRRKAAKNRKVKVAKPSIAKTDNARPLSIITDPAKAQAYRIGRDWPGFKNVSNIPL